MRSIYQLKLTLIDSQPPIWRRVQVESDATLARLHDVLQIVMGWTNSHMHGFRVPQRTQPDRVHVCFPLRAPTRKRPV